MEYILIGIIGLFTSTIGAIAGGGGLILGPALLLIGIPPTTIVATQKAGGIGINLGAISKFYRQKDAIQWQFAIAMSVLAIFASYVGTKGVLLLEDDQIEKLIATITLILVPFFLLSRGAGLEKRDSNSLQRVYGTVIYWLIVALQAGVGGGVGTLSMFVLIGPLGFTALQANATKRLIGFVLTLSSMGFFIASGHVNWLLAAILFGTALIGGVTGATIAIKHGSILVKRVLIAVSILMAVLLLI